MQRPATIFLKWWGSERLNIKALLSGLQRFDAHSTPLRGNCYKTLARAAGSGEVGEAAR
jgi:hypothetical protein